MITYRLLQKWVEDANQWEVAGVAFSGEDQIRFYYRGSIQYLPLHDLNELSKAHFPDEPDENFKWGREMHNWEQAQPFMPEAIIPNAVASAPTPLENVELTVEAQPEANQPEAERPRRSLESEVTNREEVISAYEATLEVINKQIEDKLRTMQDRVTAQLNEVKRRFIDDYNYGGTPLPEIVRILWDDWTKNESDPPPFPDPTYNVVLFLYAWVFGFATAETRSQKAYLDGYRDYYKPLFPAPRKWGARASLSKHIPPMPDSPVVHAYLFVQEKTPRRVVIIGRGLEAHRQRLFFDALTTVIQVQASGSDLVNDGVISFDYQTNAELLPIPVLGSAAPTHELETAKSAVNELKSHLELMGRKTGFVEIHEVSFDEYRKYDSEFRRLSEQAAKNFRPVILAPDAGGNAAKFVALQPIYSYQRTHVHQTPVRAKWRPQRIEPITLTLSPLLLATPVWRKLLKAHVNHIIYQIELDAKIRLEYYRSRAEGLKAEKKQWDAADPQMRQERWGPEVTLNQRFEVETGLTISIPPKTIATADYYEVQVPELIRSHEFWRDKMQTIVDSLEKAARRPDAPFERFITTRLFDAALRGRPLEGMPVRIQKLYDSWAAPIRNLLSFEWRQKLKRENADPDDLFTNQTTFYLEQTSVEVRPGVTAIDGLVLVPVSVFDTRSSVVLFDPERYFIQIKDASAFPQKPSDEKIDIAQELRQHLKDAAMTVPELTEWLRQKLIIDPATASRQILEYFMPEDDYQAFSADLKALSQLYKEARSHTQFSYYLNRLQNAMLYRAIHTTRESVEKARKALQPMQQQWEKLNQRPDDKKLPELGELECRLFLLAVLGECLAALPADTDLTKYLPKILGASTAHENLQIHRAIQEARHAHAGYTETWIENLGNLPIGASYNKLVRDLPNHQKLTTLAEHGVLKMADIIEIIRLSERLQQASDSLSQTHETRSSAFVKLGPSLEDAILSEPAGILSDVQWLLTVLTGRETEF